ncbi:MAG: MFS transporter [Acetobacteraceae bacterium]|nr:MFS transporter [Acetobacteraceae bacterium]
MRGAAEDLLDSGAAWRRLAAIIALGAVGGVGLWSVVVALPHVQAEFGATRAEASLPYTLVMLGLAAGAVAMGRAADRFGPMRPLVLGTVIISAGYVLAGLAPSLLVFALAHGLLIGLGSSASFAPLVADASLWFRRRRGIAVALAACGNYFAGAAWPPILTALIEAYGWRVAHVAVGVACLVLMLPLSLALRARAPGLREPPPAPRPGGPVPMSSNALTAVLCVAGFACCMAMAMPQVHIVAYCGDLGYGVARGAEMLSLMLVTGVVSRIASGFIADRIGGLLTLLLGSTLQGLALLLFLFFDSLASLYLLSALFGLVQGGIVPAYAVIVRERLPAAEAGGRIGIVLMSTMVGMAAGGWMSGVVFDLTGSYAAAFVNGVLWNLVNVAVVLWLLGRGASRRPAAAARGVTP